MAGDVFTDLLTCQNVAGIEDANAATAVVQQWLDAAYTRPNYAFYVVDVADIGTAWLAISGSRDELNPWNPGWKNAALVDKATGEVLSENQKSPRIGPSARDGFLRMIRSSVGPQLRLLGFDGKGTKVFTLPSATHFATRSFQRSMGNRWVEASFTAPRLDHRLVETPRRLALRSRSVVADLGGPSHRHHCGGDRRRRS